MLPIYCDEAVGLPILQTLKSVPGWFSRLRSLENQNPMNSHELTRRGLLGGAVAAAVAPTLAKAAPKRPVAPNGMDAAPGMRRRCQHASVVLPGGLILVCGGYASLGDSRPLNSVQIYDPYQDEWTDVAPMIQARARHSAGVLSYGRVVVFGGVATTPLSSVEFFDPGNNTWIAGRPLRTRRLDHSVQIVEDTAFLTGGIAGMEDVSATLGIEVYRMRRNRRA